MKLKDHQVAYLERVSRQMGKHLGRAVSKREVYDALFEMAIRDEGLFDPERPSRPISVERREIVQAETATRTSSLEPHELLQIVLSRSDPALAPRDES